MWKPVSQSQHVSVGLGDSSAAIEEAFVRTVPPQVAKCRSQTKGDTQVEHQTPSEHLYKRRIVSMDVNGGSVTCCKARRRQIENGCSSTHPLNWLDVILRPHGRGLS